MADEGFKRKLAAILSADVEGYSRLMDDDEEATVRTLTAYRTAIADLVQQFRGRIVDTPGDNILAEFTSVVESVNCAVEIQRELAERNAELPDNRRMEFRIGVNLGDVIEEEGRIYGDGVNIAARVESLSEAGGICISGRAHDQVENKLELEYEDLGKHEVKNISRPIQVYRVLSYPGAAAHRVVKAKETLGRRWRKIAISAAVVVVIAVGLGIWQFYVRRPAVEPASVEKMAFPLPEKPSIAVLPFVNMSGDPEQEYIGDSFTENIITALSYVPEMFVIARTSTSAYKGKSVKINQISEELGVRYVLEGSIQKANDRIRVTAQLIDAISGHHLWADRYDRNIEDFFKVLDEIAKKVVIELQVNLTEGDVSRITHKTENFEAWLSAITAYSFVKLTTKENIAKAKELFEKAIRLDPEYGFAWSGLGSAHNVEGMMGWSESREKSFELAVEYIDKAIKLDENLSCATSIKGRLHRMQGQFEQAIATGKRAIRLGPSHDLPYAVLSSTMRYAGRYEESIALMEKAMRLNPHYPAFYLNTLAMDYYFLQRYEEAVGILTRLLERAQKGEWPSLYAHLDLSANYIELGKDEEAEAHAEQVIKINPNFSLESSARNISRYKNKEDYERYLESLRKAGFPEHPPLPLPDKPSIAVLAFDNLTGDPEQEYFSDGITEEIITALSKTPKLLVIARTSTFSYKGKPVKIKQVAEELGVRYVLEGSVREAEGKVRITAQLIDAKTGHHLWAERYDRDLKDIFDIQDEITKKIITALRVHLTEGEFARILDRHTNNIQAYMKILEGSGYFGEDKYSEGMKCFEEAISLDPQCASAHSWLSWAHLMNVWFGPSATRKQSLKKAFELAEKCRALDDTHGGCYGALSHAYLMKRDYDKAISEGKRAVELDPNTSKWAVNYGWALRSVGRYEDALLEYERALRLNPLDKARPLEHICTTYNMMRRHEEAIETCKKVIELAPRSLPSYINLAVAYSELEQMDEAREAADKVLKINPNFSVVSLEKALPYKNKADKDLIVNNLRKAGLK